MGVLFLYDNVHYGKAMICPIMHLLQRSQRARGRAFLRYNEVMRLRGLVTYEYPSN